MSDFVKLPNCISGYLSFLRQMFNAKSRPRGFQSSLNHLWTPTWERIFWGEGKQKHLLNLGEKWDEILKIMRKQKLNTFRVVTRREFSRMTLIMHWNPLTWWLEESAFLPSSPWLPELLWKCRLSHAGGQCCHSCCPWPGRRKCENALQWL